MSSCVRRLAFGFPTKFRIYLVEKVKNKTLTPWCTCTGSEVCSYYADEFNDGTHIKFINNPNTNEVTYNPKSKNEGKYKNKFNIYSHRTPGIK